MSGVFPQAGIITAFKETTAEAKVYIPLFTLETEWVPVNTVLLSEINVGDEVVLNFLNGNFNNGVVVAKMK